MLLAPLAARLVDAGLNRVNISCDSLRPERFNARCVAAATSRPCWAPWTRPRRRDSTPLKVNVVILRGVNDDEVLDFAAFARATGRVVRFIEFMPLDAQGEWDESQLVSGREVLRRDLGRGGRVRRPSTPTVGPGGALSLSSTAPARSGSSHR